jgi:hypothetical protein
MTQFDTTLWEALRPAIVLLGYFVAFYAATKLLDQSVRGLFNGILSELAAIVAAIIQRRPNAKSLNLLFALMIFFLIVLFFIKVAVSSLFDTVRPNHTAFTLQSEAWLFASVLILTIYVMLSLKYCTKVERIAPQRDTLPDEDAENGKPG